MLDEVVKRFAQYKAEIEPELREQLARDPSEAKRRQELAKAYSDELAEMVLAAERPAGEWLFALAVHGGGGLLGVPVRAGERPREA